MQRRHLIAHPLHRVEDVLGPVVDPFSILGHRNPSGGAVQQANAEAVLEQADALADERGGGAELGGGGDEAGAAGDHDEDAEVLKVRHTVHDSCFINQ
ncbi:hypothetical protein D3C78_1751200 [compost metagenome]